MKKQGSFFTTVIRIALPVALQCMLQSSFYMIDQIMVGQLGSISIAAVEIAGKPLFIYSFVIGAVAAIAGIMIAQYYGKKDIEAVERSVSVNLTSVFVLAILFIVITLCCSEGIVGIFTNDRNVTEAATPYLRIVTGTYLPMGIATILAVRIRCMEKAVYPLYAGIASALINTGLNWLLIFGNLGMPKLGIVGAAIASVISQLLNVALMLIFYLRLSRSRGHFSLRLGKEGYSRYFVMLLPVVLNELLWTIGQNVNTYIYGHIGTRELAAMSLTGPVQMLFIGALSGVSQAAGILIGKRLGESAYNEAYKEAKKLCWYGFAGSIALSMVLLLLRRPYVQTYLVEEEVRRIAANLLTVFALLAPVKVQNMVLGGGIIRSGGKTRYIMWIDVLGTWLVGVPLGLVSAFYFHLSIVSVYFILSMEELVRWIISLFLFRSRKWMETL